jgi:hypothetical protein
MYQKQNLYNKFKESLRKEKEKEKDIQFNIEKNRTVLLDNISQDINDVSSLKKEESDLFKNNEDKSLTIKNEEYFDYKSKKLKLFNLYNQLLEFRNKLVIKEKELNKKEKNLLEFENVLKTNEAILKSNIEQFDIYIKQKIGEIKNQFKQIEKLQISKENFLKQKEKEIIHFKNKSFDFPKNQFVKNKDNNNCNHINCNCDLCNEEKIIKPFIDNYLSEITLDENDKIFNNNINKYKKINNYTKNHSSYNNRNIYLNTLNHQKTYSVNINHNNSRMLNLRKNFFEINKKNKVCGRKINNIFNNSNDYSGINYTCSCQGCKFCAF